MPRKDHYVLIAKLRDIWHENAIDLNIADHAGRQAIDGIPVLISDIINTMRWDM